MAAVLAATDGALGEVRAPHIPVLLVPRPDGWAEMPQAQLREAQAKVERSWRTLGFSPYHADHEVWWAPSTAVVRQIRK